MVRVSKEVAEQRMKIALNSAKNLEVMRDNDPNESVREACKIVINSLKRTAYGGKWNEEGNSSD